MAIGNVQIGQQSMLDQLHDMQSKVRFETKNKPTTDSGESSSFMDYLKDSIKTVNVQQVESDKMSVDLATGKSQNLHETMLSASQAELSFNLMVQMRNKVLEAYQEIMRMQV